MIPQSTWGAETAGQIHKRKADDAVFLLEHWYWRFGCIEINPTPIDRTIGNSSDKTRRRRERSHPNRQRSSSSMKIPSVNSWRTLLPVHWHANSFPANINTSCLQGGIPLS